MSEIGLKVTTGEASEIVHVHESTIKRWCDAGRIDHVRTPGGHRRVVLSSLLDYARTEDLECDFLQFGERAEIVYQTLERARDERFSASVAFLFGGLRDRGDETIGAFLKLLLTQGLRLEQLFDKVVGPVLHRVGNGWSSGAMG
ncbi:MAG: helix-turn-helix domain-containing protein, partial [Rhodothermales bacterium]